MKASSFLFHKIQARLYAVPEFFRPDEAHTSP